MESKADYIGKLNIVLLFHMGRGTRNPKIEAGPKHGVGITFHAFWPLRYFHDESQCRSQYYFR